MIAHVICCNDGIEAVVLDDENMAKTNMEILAKEHYAKNHFEYKDYTEYRKSLYWHLHSVTVLEQEIKLPEPVNPMMVQSLDKDELYEFNVYDKSWNLKAHHYSATDYGMKMYGDFKEFSGQYYKIMCKTKYRRG